MMRICFIVVFFLVSPVFSNLFAAEVLTLEEAYRLAMTRNEQIGIAREGLSQAEKEIDRAKSFLYPRLSTDAGYLRRPDPILSGGFGVLRPESQKQFNITFEQPLYTGGRATAAYRGAKLGLKGEALALNLTTENLLFQVAQAYYEALKALKNTEIEKNEVARLEAHLKDAQNRLRVGEVTKTVVLRAEAELADARARLIRAENNQAITKDQLAFLVNSDGEFDLTEPPSLALSERSESEWIETARDRRDDLRRQAAEIEIAKERINVAKGNFYPSLNLEAQYNWIDPNPQSAFFITNDRFAIIKLSFPLFEGKIRVAELNQSKSRHRQAILQKELLSDRISVEVRRARFDLAALTAQLDVLRAQVAFARENFTLVSRQFAVGLATNIDVLDANAVLISAERQLANTTYDRETAILQLEKSSGVFLDLLPAAVKRDG